MRLVDDEKQLGKTAVLLVVEHSTPPENDIDGANEKVREFYTDGAWRPGDGRTAKQYIDSYIK